MQKKKSASASKRQERGDKPLAVTRFQKFVVERWNRRDIRNAPYNPRKIDDAARRLLRDNLNTVGLLGPVTVNRRTRNMVGGHQRLALLDALEGTDAYLIDVAVVELSDKAEREQNLFMNNPAAQGDWDLPALKAVIEEIDWQAAGFSAADLAVLDIEVPDDFALVAKAEKTKRAPKKHEGVEERRAAYQEREDAINATDFYLTVVFRDAESRASVLSQIGFEPTDAEDMQYIKSEVFVALINGLRPRTRLTLPSPATPAK